jgi:hypothetical protein
MSVASEGIWFPITNNHHIHSPTIDQSADNIQPALNTHEISSVKSTDRQQLTVHSTCRSPIESQAKATLVDGYTQLVTDRVKAGWS